MLTNRSLLLAGLFGSSILGSATARAQAASAQDQPPATEAVVEGDIIVTATRRNERLQAVPLTISAITGENLLKQSASSFQDFFRNVSGLSVYDQGPGDKRYIVRGINASGAGTVGLYLDEAVITGENAQDGGGRQPDTRLFDIERIEVLKGPQGTTFGSGSLAGTIRYITNKPDAKIFDAQIVARVGATKGAALSRAAEAMINIPIINDHLAFRASGLIERQNGWIDSPVRRGANGYDVAAGRAQLRWTPDTAVTFDLTYMRQDVDTDGNSYYDKCQYIRANQPATTCVSTNSKNLQNDIVRVPFTDTQDLYSAVLNANVASGTVTFAASSIDQFTRFNRDVSGVFAYFLNTNANVAGTQSLLTQPKQRRLDSYEARYASNFGGWLEILAGGFYSREKRSFQSAIYVANADGTVPASPTRYLDRSLNTRITQKALFGELTFKLADGLKLTGGLRYGAFSSNGQAAVAVTFFGPVNNPPVLSAPLSFSDDTLVKKLNLSWEVTPDVLLYGGFSEGFRAGGVQDQGAGFVSGNNIPDGFGSDSLDNYELGAKTQFFDRQLTINGSVYHIDWSGIQLKAQASSTIIINGNPVTTVYPYVLNGGQAKVDGAELEASYVGRNGFNLAVLLAYTNARLSANDPASATTGGRTGDRLPYVPRFTATISPGYRWSLGDGEGRIGADLAYVGDRASELNNVVAPLSSFYRRFPAYTLVGLSAGASIRNWDIALNATNIFNSRKDTDVFRDIDEPGYVTFDRYLALRPRTVTAQITYRYR